jgi:hypothetical protein
MGISLRVLCVVRNLCDELIFRLEESYRLWCVVECDLETSWMRSPWPTGGCRAKTNNWCTNNGCYYPQTAVNFMYLSLHFVFLLINFSAAHFDIHKSNIWSQETPRFLARVNTCLKKKHPCRGSSVLFPFSERSRFISWAEC